MPFNEEVKRLTTKDRNHASVFNEVHEQLLENTKENRDGIGRLKDELDFKFSNAKFTIMDDDCSGEVLTILKPLLDARHIKASEGIITDFVGTPNYLTLDQLHVLQNDGWEIVSHSQTVDSITTDNMWWFPEQSQNYLKEHGFNGHNVFVYPNGLHSDVEEIGRAVGAFYDYAFNVYDGCNQQPYNKVNMNRVFLKENESIETERIKAMVDDTFKNNGWLVLGCHAWDLYDGNAERLMSVIDYILSNGGKFHTVNEVIDSMETKPIVDNLRYTNSQLQLTANGKPVGDKIFITAGESVKVNMFKTQSDIKTFTADKVTNIVPIPDLKESQIVKAVFDNLVLIEGVDFVVNSEVKEMVLIFDLKIGEKVHYILESVSYQFDDLAGIPSTFPPSTHKHNASDIEGISAEVHWNSVQGKPSTFPPATHVHTKADVGLNLVPNYEATSAINDASHNKFATAYAVKYTYDKAVEALNSSKSSGVIKSVQRGTSRSSDTASANTVVPISTINPNKAFVLIQGEYCISGIQFPRVLNLTANEVTFSPHFYNSGRTFGWQVIETY